ncbi:MAG: hypothetical protein SH809_15970 [Rhodothermales bacterium]|nr:hypothetical protein [Rhodothermales bacterium]
MIDSVEGTGPRKSAGDTRPAYEFIVHSVRQQGDGDGPDLVLRRSPIDRPGQPAREDVTVIVREINASAEEKKSVDGAAPELKPIADRVAEYVASLSDDVTEEVVRVVDFLIAEEERVEAPADLAGPFTSDGSPFADSALPTAPSPNRYTKRVEFDRS